MDTHKHKNKENLSIYLWTCKLIVTLKKVVRTSELQHKEGAEQGTQGSVNKSCYGRKSRAHHDVSRTSTQELV